MVAGTAPTAQLQGSPTRSSNDVWIVIPAYNEGPAIGRVVEDLVALGWPVVVVDDGSRDDSAGRAEAAGAVVLRHVVNLGQGAALQTGIDYALARGARVLVTFDADGQHDPQGIPRLLSGIDAGADVVLGSRFLGTAEGVTRMRAVFLRAAVSVSNALSGMRLTDAHCGIRAIHARAAPALRISQDRMAHASELLRKMRTARLRVVEVPVMVRYTDYSRAKGQSAFQAIRILFDYFFRPPPARS